MSMDADLATPFEGLIGQTLASRYKIESKIGEGAMGAVYRAKHVKVGRPFAVKVLHPRLLVDGKQLQRFEREAELAGRLRHPNVIGVVDVGETPDGLRYMVMEFAEGSDLAALLSDAPFTPQRIIQLTRQMLEGLFHAHEAGLIHRDFKPENVIIEKDSHGAEVPRIVDFGIAILREGGDSTDGPGRLTTNGLVLGTPHYMAPEQAVADPIDHRIDLFALGIIVYEMLCGKLPFDGSGAEVARANLLLDPPPIAERVPYLAVDPLLEAFARRLMAKKRDARPATAKVARDLLDLIERDRDAAAKALKVAPDDARLPATTQPQEPMRHHSGNETFPPPIRKAEPARQAPPLTNVKAVAARGEDVGLTTDMAPPQKRRAPMIAAGLVGAGILATGLVLLLGGSDNPAQRDNVAATPPAPSETPTPVETKPEPTPAPSIEPIEPPVEEPVVEPVTAAPVKVKITPKATPKAAAKTTSKAATTRVQTPVETKPVETKPVETKPVETKPVETKPAETKAIDSGALATQYKSVGSQLKALQDAKGPDAVSDLWSRYRFIRLSDSMTTQQKRDEAAAILAKLAIEIAARKK